MVKDEVNGSFRPSREKMWSNEMDGFGRMDFGPCLSRAGLFTPSFLWASFGGRTPDRSKGLFKQRMDVLE